MANSAVSYVHGSIGPSLVSETVGSMLDRAVERWPDREALVSRHQHIRWSWRELADRADRFAAGLVALGLRKGDRIGIWSPNNAEWVVTMLAAARAGLIVVTINPAYRVQELEYALNKVGCRALVTATSFRQSDYVAMLNSIAPELATCLPGSLSAARVSTLFAVIQFGGAIAPGFIAFDQVPDLADAKSREELSRTKGRIQCDDPIMIQFTSGTTGAPKGATLSHHNLVNNSLLSGSYMRLPDRARVCVPVPLYHIFGTNGGVMACMGLGTTLVLPSEGFEPLAVLQAVAEERCEALYGVPTMFIAEMAHPDFGTFDLSCLRTGYIGGAPCPIEVLRQMIERMHLRDMIVAFGMTETSPCSFLTSLDDSLERRVTTVGRVTPHVEVKIVDAEGRIVARNQPGEICVRGYLTMLGYWGDAERTAEAIDQARWMHTGDIGVIDEEGYCSIVGRIKDMIIRGGENIYPREIEEFLFRHPKIQEVQVFGVSDERYGEELCAWIRLAAGEAMTQQEVSTFCSGQIAHFKIPRHVRFVDSFPTTVTGKVQKFAMREIMEREMKSEKSLRVSA